MTAAQTTFLNRHGIISGRQQRQEQFEIWMREKVKNIFVSDNVRMNRAIEEIE